MTTVQETIPESLRPEIDAALEWFNSGETTHFEVTGILDPEASLESSGPRELRLVICGGDRCEQRSFMVRPGDAGYEVAFLEDTGAAADVKSQSIPAELDPPPGALRGWIERTLPKHSFVLLVFYRGYW